MARLRLASAWTGWLAAVLLLLHAQGTGAVRPNPAVDGANSGGLAAPQFPARPYNRRLLLVQPGSSGTAMAPEATAVGMMWAPQLEAAVAELAAGGLRLSPSQQQRQKAMDELVLDAEALADEVIVATRGELDALGARLVASIPVGTSAAGMATLLQTTDFNAQLKAAVDDAVVVVSRAMEPHLEVVASTVHSTLQRLAAAPDTLLPRPAFADAFLPGFVEKFSLNIVEATLLHSLWHDL